MRHCFYHTDLGQKAVFHNFAVQTALVQYSGRWKYEWAFSKTLKKISKITQTAIRFSLLQCEPWRMFELTLTESRSHIIKNLLCLFLFNGLTRGILSIPASDVH